MITAVAITWTLVTCLYKPLGRPFKVTDKDGDRSRTIVRWDMLRVFGAIMVVSLLAIAWALIGPDATAESSPVDLLNLVWAGISALLSGIACLVCFEKPRLHREELFSHDRAGRLSCEAGELSCAVTRLTTVDARLRLGRRPRHLTIGTVVTLLVEGVASVRGIVTRRRGRELVMSFVLPEIERRAMVVSLYGNPKTTFRCVRTSGERWPASGGAASAGSEPGPAWQVAASTALLPTYTVGRRSTRLRAIDVQGSSPSGSWRRALEGTFLLLRVSPSRQRPLRP